MAVNYRDLLNRVLTALREDEIADSVAELTDPYHKLLGLFVNQIKEQVEDAHNWRALRALQEVTVLSGTTSISIPNANERSRVLRVYDELRGEEVALVFDVTDANNPYRLREMDMSELLRRRSLDTTSGNDPAWFAMDNSGESAMAIQVHPTPTDNRDLEITMIVPQERFAIDDLDVNIKVPAGPIEMGASWYSMNERGEELGVNGLFNQELFDRSLGSAVAMDAAEQGEYNLVPV